LIVDSQPHVMRGRARGSISENNQEQADMKFSDFISVASIKADLSADAKPDAIRELVQSLSTSGAIASADVDGIVAAIMKREELGSTGIGRGVAVPHTKHASVERLVGTVGVSVEGVDFNSLDGDKVHLFFLLVSPPDRPGDHLRALENISRQLRDDTFCRFLKQSRSAQDIQQLLDEADNNQFAS
jgi:PTS system fructose-specific IIA component/PTS system nitrogen regulatory IIA component